MLSVNCQDSDTVSPSRLGGVGVKCKVWKVVVAPNTRAAKSLSVPFGALIPSTAAGGMLLG